jgi:hypothetical protein
LSAKRNVFTNFLQNVTCSQIFVQLLLHHVIPGAFELSSLQDEMTGVSLAGTQLRVNTYNTQDAEWNDVQVRPRHTYKVSRKLLTVGIARGSHGPLNIPT